MQSQLPLTFGPRYRVVAEIASGGMGAIVLALRVDPDGSKTPVAVKQLHAHLASDPEIVAYFVDEARIASRIVHPNVVRVEDVEMAGSEIVIVMQYVEGVSLSVMLKTLRAAESSMPVPIVRRILHDALLGLHAAHELRDANGAPLDVVHRDVSPHNILVSVDGVARVSDFGIATATGRVASTRTGGGVKGKLQYLSPEQIYRKPVDRRTDVFAAGTVLWECLTGRRLFSAPTEGETLAMVLREPIAPPSTHRPDVPLELDEACLRALERAPSNRYATAEELARALEESGPLASREQVAAMVGQMASSTIAARRQLIEQAMRSTHVHPNELASPSFAGAAVDSAQPIEATITPQRASPSRLPLVAALLVGLVAGGVGVGLAARRAPAVATSPALSESIAAPIAVASEVATTTMATTMATTTPAATTAAPTATVAMSASPAASSSSSTATKRSSSKKTPGGRPFMPSDL